MFGTNSGPPTRARPRGRQSSEVGSLYPGACEGGKIDLAWPTRGGGLSSRLTFSPIPTPGDPRLRHLKTSVKTSSPLVSLTARRRGGVGRRGPVSGSRWRIRGSRERWRGGFNTTPSLTPFGHLLSNYYSIRVFNRPSPDTGRPTRVPHGSLLPTPPRPRKSLSLDPLWSGEGPSLVPHRGRRTRRRLPVTELVSGTGVGPEGAFVPDADDVARERPRSPSDFFPTRPAVRTPTSRTDSGARTGASPRPSPISFAGPDCRSPDSHSSNPLPGPTRSGPPPPQDRDTWDRKEKK